MGGHTPYWHSANIISVHYKIQLLLCNINPFYQAQSDLLWAPFSEKERKKRKEKKSLLPEKEKNVPILSL